MARSVAYENVQPAEAKDHRKSRAPGAEQEPQPEAPATDPRDFEADYAEDRSVAVLAERRRQALANNTRSFVDVDLP